VNARQIHSWQALCAGWRLLHQHPRLLIAFSLSTLGLHWLGWALFAVAAQVNSGVLSALLHGSGITLYGGSLLWMVEGLTRAALNLWQGAPISWRKLWRGEMLHRWILLGSLGYLIAAELTAALISFVVWSLVVVVWPGMGAAPVLVGLVAATALAISQQFTACLVIASGSGPLATFRAGMVLLEHHWTGLAQLAGVVLAIFVSPLLVGLFAEAMVAGLGIVATALGFGIVLPLMAATVTAAFHQLHPNAEAGAALKQSAR
jgi:hypothetical protein